MFEPEVYLIREYSARKIIFAKASPIPLSKIHKLLETWREYNLRGKFKQLGIAVA